ncbi:helix-turn-helix transcriptional regulator [Rhodoferax ferrireducens]|uniref:helix-turn-helix transcriptional regulator n=1 Tax=Rhodoferax ferrireducens TaxID=192843 RepID=UPI000E0D76B0|nr:hypothetical protein [Rhodoferax ferrireducens]
MKPAIVQIPPMFLARANAAAFLSVSESMLDQLVARGEVAKPKKLSPGRSAWLVDDLVTFGRTRPESDLLPPANSGYGRAGKPD